MDKIPIVEKLMKIAGGTLPVIDGELFETAHDAADLIEALVAALEETTQALSQCEAGPRIDNARAVLAKAKS